PPPNSTGWKTRSPGRSMAIERTGSRLSTLRNWLFLLVVWELLGRYQLVAGGALPAPSAVLGRLWVDRADYPPHVWATLAGASSGFLIGNLLAIAAGAVFALFP